MKAISIAVGLFLLMFAGSALAQQEPARKIADAGKPDVVTKVYDIRDLLWNGADRNESSTIVPPTKIGEPKPVLDSGQGGGVGGGPPSAKAKPNAADSPVDEIRLLILETVAPESWRDTGGTIGAIRMVHGMMVVSQTAENHQAIQTLLSQLRENSARLVTVVARWILLDSGQMQQLAQPARQAGDSAAIRIINPADLEKLPAGAMKYRAQITCFNGQTVRLSSGKAKTVITGLTAAVGTGVAAYQPDAAIVQDGISLQLIPMVPPGSPTALIDIENIVSDWNGIRPSPLAPTTQPMNMDAPATIDRVDIQVQQFHTSIAVPVGKPVLVAALPATSRSEKDDAGKLLYLVIEVLGDK
ncbi:MAG TPA: hypothetical protein VH370_15885 [Humisphaera sp.]|nr:hypothetical protein [Humisphaera sp.]